jgi:hypothetical protein
MKKPSVPEATAVKKTGAKTIIGLYLLVEKYKLIY